VRLRTDAGTTPVTLVQVEGQPAAWRLSHPSLSTRWDGMMEVVVSGRTYLAPVGFASIEGIDGIEGEAVFVARHGGRVIAFTDCPAHVEVVQDVRAGRLTIYPFNDAPLVEAPIVTI